MDIENAANSCEDCDCTKNSKKVKLSDTSSFLPEKYLQLPYHIKCNILKYLTDEELIRLLVNFTDDKNIADCLLPKSSNIWGKLTIRVVDYKSMAEVYKIFTALQQKLEVPDQEINLDFSECSSRHIRDYFYEFDNTQSKSCLKKEEKGDAIDFLRNTVTSIDLSLMNLDESFTARNSPIIYRIMSKLPKVNTLKITDCDWLSEAEVRMIRLLPGLKNLDASSNSGLNDLFIDHISSSFSVERNLGITPLDLTSLNLLDSPNIAASGISTVCRQFVNLENLYLDGENLAAFNGIGLGKLKHLKTLHIMYINENLDDVEFLENMMKSGVKQQFSNLKLTQKKFNTELLDEFLEMKLSNNASIIELTDAGVQNSTVKLILEKSQCIKILHLNWNRDLDDRIFYEFAMKGESSFSKLKRLSLVGCNKALATHGDYPWFTEDVVRREFPSLRYVSFAGCDFVNDKALKCIVKSFGKRITVRDYYDEAIDCCGQNCCFET